MLAGLTTNTLGYAITANNASPTVGTVLVRVTSTQGASLDIPITVAVQELRPVLVAMPNTLFAGMARGKQAIVEFDVVNEGAANSGPITVSLPSVGWLSLASTNPLPALAPAATNHVTLLLTPAADQPLGDYAGYLALNGSNVSSSVPFTFRSVSQAVGDLEVMVEDDYTYYAAGAPRVGGALVQILDPYDSSLINQVTTDTNGLAIFSNLTEGNYLLRVTATKHSSRDVQIKIQPGLTTKTRVLIPSQTVRFSWTATPNSIPDRYDLTVTTVFETVVPFPRVTATPLLVPIVYPGKVTQTSITLTNSGLIAAKNVKVTPKSTSTYLITPLVTDIGDIPAKGSITIPVLVQIQPELDARILEGLSHQKPGSLSKQTSTQSAAAGVGFLDECEQPEIEVIYIVVCGTDNLYHDVKIDLRPITLLEDLLGCIEALAELELKPWSIIGAVCDCAASAAAIIGGALGGDGEVPKGVECLCAAIGLDIIGLSECICFNVPPASGGGGTPDEKGDEKRGKPIGQTTEPWPPIPESGCGILPAITRLSSKVSSANISQPSSESGICARVKLQTDQSLVLTRSAFRGTLNIENNLPSSLSNVFFRIEFLDAQGQSANDKFGIQAPLLSKVSGVDGTGVLGGETSGSAEYTFVPTVEAALGGQTPYTVGGQLRYNDGQNDVIIDLAPVPISVMPQPRLIVDYFHQRDVFSDDPFTEVVEPAVPYSLAIMLRNVGQGIARDVNITSGQPKIVENEKGLLIDFKIISTEVFGPNGINKLTPSLTANFGSIGPSEIKIGRWLLTSTLQGLFIDYNATFQHLDGLGNISLSLISSNDFRIHEMIHLVSDPRAGADALPDFLVNETPDLNDHPETLYLSDGSTNLVSVMTGGLLIGSVSMSSLVVTQTAVMTPGWTYLRVPDPGNGLYSLTSVVRSDGVPIYLNTNVWTTDRTFIGMGLRPIRENILHLLDYNSPGSYTLQYAAPLPPDTNAPTSSVTALPAQSSIQIPVSWSGTDNAGGGGIAAYNIYVSENNDAFIPWLQGTTLNGSLYSGVFGHSYAFYSVARDLAGNTEPAPFTPDAFTSITLSNHPPFLGTISNAFIDEGTELNLNLTASDPDLPDDALTFMLLSSPPGMTLTKLNETTAQLRWSTGEGNGPSTNLVTVVTRDNGFPSLSATSLVTVVVREVNVPPVLNSITNRTIAEGFLLNITNLAQDFDQPAQQLTFKLASGAPTNATIHPVSGLFTWLPTELQGGTTNQFSVIVTDSGNPPLGATQTFTIIVRDTSPDFLMSLGTTQLLSGATSSVPLTLHSGSDITNVHLVLAVSSDRLTNLTLQSLAPEVVGVDFLPLGSNRFDLQFRSQANAPLQGDLVLAQLAFATITNEHSAVAHLKGESVQGTRASATQLLNGSIGNGRIFIVAREPILDAALTTNHLMAWTVYGLPGKRYALERRLGLNGTNAWTFVEAISVDALKTVPPPLPVSAGMEFFRLYELPESQLNLRLVGSQAIVEWPMDCAGCVLEEAEVLGPGAVWLPSAAQPQLIGDRYRMNLPGGSAARYYRLAVPLP